MKILLLSIDSKLPNLALKKIEMWHRLQGDEIIWDMPIMINIVDKVYASCVFTWNRHKAENYKGLNPSLIIGGSGWDLETNLPEDIEAMKPKINYGFTTRGCIRNCQYCVVPRKEGNIKIVGDLLDLWDGKSKTVIVIDNNILAVPDHFKMICQQARENGIKLDFNQGLDHRLITPEIAKTMANVSHAEYHLAFDHPSYKTSVEKAINLLREVGINRCTWYILVGFNTTKEEDLSRLNYLRDNNQRAYVARFGDSRNQPFYIGLARWANQQNIYMTMTWQEFLDYPRPDHRRLKKQIEERGNEIV